jgi:hypothetical protein
LSVEKDGNYRDCTYNCTSKDDVLSNLNIEPLTAMPERAAKVRLVTVSAFALWRPNESIPKTASPEIRNLDFLFLFNVTPFKGTADFK